MDVRKKIFSSMETCQFTWVLFGNILLLEMNLSVSNNLSFISAIYLLSGDYNRTCLDEHGMSDTVSGDYNRTVNIVGGYRE